MEVGKTVTIKGGPHAGKVGVVEEVHYAVDDEGEATEEVTECLVVCDVKTWVPVADLS